MVALNYSNEFSVVTEKEQTKLSSIDEETDERRDSPANVRIVTSSFASVEKSPYFRNVSRPPLPKQMSNSVSRIRSATASDRRTSAVQTPRIVDALSMACWNSSNVPNGP